MSSTGNRRPRECKLVLLGESGVGKSSLVLRFVTNNFRAATESTIGASFMSKMILVDGAPIKFQIWDTAGQEKYHSLAPMYYKGAAAAIIVYVVTLLLLLLLLLCHYARPAATTTATTITTTTTNSPLTNSPPPPPPPLLLLTS